MSDPTDPADGEDADASVPNPDEDADYSVPNPDEGTDEEGDAEGPYADAELPADVLESVERLTRLARRAVDESEREAYLERRDRLLEPYDVTARVREADDTLVVHPAEWLDEDTVRTDRIEDLSRAVEISLAGPGDPDEWDAVDATNRELVRAVREAHGDVHGDNAAALADFAGNHYAKPITEASAAELAEFRSEYFVRNAWPSDEQRAVLDRSIELAFEAAGESPPDR